MTKDVMAWLMERIEQASKWLYYLSALAIVLAAFVLTYQVIVRYILKVPTIWEIEFSVYLMIFATFVGAAYGLKEGAHINIDMITRLLPPRVNRRLSLITSLLSLIFCILVAWKGWGMWWEAAAKGWRSESLWGPPLAIPYLFLPLGMTLLSIQYLNLIFGLFKGGKGHGS